MSKAGSFFREFQEFAVKGNMIDLAVGVIIGGAFGKIIDSLVSDIIMPMVTFVMGGEVDFTNRFIVLRHPAGYSGPETYDALTEAGAVVLSWGSFLTVFINFVLLAFVVFMLVKAVNATRRRLENLAHHEQAQADAAPEEPAPEPTDVALLRDIRDLLGRQVGSQDGGRTS